MCASFLHGIHEIFNSRDWGGSAQVSGPTIFEFAGVALSMSVFSSMVASWVDSLCSGTVDVMINLGKPDL